VPAPVSRSSTLEAPTNNLQLVTGEAATGISVVCEMRRSPRGLDRGLVKETDFSLVALDEVVLHQLQIDPPLTTNPEGRQLPQAHAPIDRRLRDPKVPGQLFQRDHFGVGNSSICGILVIGSGRWFAPRQWRVDAA
jgi:hypothetical protein